MRAEPVHFEIVPFYPVTRFKRQQLFEQGKIAGFEFHHLAAGAAGQHMGVGGMARHEAMLTVFIMHPMQATQFLKGLDRPVDGCMADALFFQFTGCVRDGIAIGCVAEQLPD